MTMPDIPVWLIWAMGSGVTVALAWGWCLWVDRQELTDFPEVHFDPLDRDGTP